MNRFTHILNDNNLTDNSAFGEIVTIRIELNLNGTRIGHFQNKFKNRAKRLDINAFHMHRSLCRDARVLLSRSGVSEKRLASAVYKVLAQITDDSYTHNVKTTTQGYSFCLNVFSTMNFVEYFQDPNWIGESPLSAVLPLWLEYQYEFV